MKPDEIKKARKEKGLTQVEVANLLEVSVASVRMWEAGGYKPSAENLEKLKEVLGVKQT